MQRRYGLGVLTAFLTLLIVGAGGVVAHKGATGIVMKRMNGMKAMGKEMKSVAAMVTGKKKYDAAMVKAAAKTIRTHANAIPQLFPKGSTQHPSEVRPEIWTRWADFQASAKRLAELAAALEVSAGNDRTAKPHKMTPKMMSDPDHLKTMPPKFVFIQVSKTCTACHKEFRKAKKK